MEKEKVSAYLQGSASSNFEDPASSTLIFVSSSFDFFLIKEKEFQMKLNRSIFDLRLQDDRSMETTELWLLENNLHLGSSIAKY